MDFTYTTYIGTNLEMQKTWVIYLILLQGITLITSYMGITIFDTKLVWVENSILRAIDKRFVEDLTLKACGLKLCFEAWS